MTGAQDPAALELLARQAEAIAKAGDFAGRSGAEQVFVLVDRGEEDPLMLEHAEDGTVEVTAEGRAAALAPAAPLPAVGRPLPEIRPAPPSALQGDPDTGELIPPIGVVAHIGESVLALARAFGGRAVAAAGVPAG